MHVRAKSNKMAEYKQRVKRFSATWLEVKVDGRSSFRPLVNYKSPPTKYADQLNQNHY